MCREVVAVLKVLKQQRDMSLNEVRQWRSAAWMVLEAVLYRLRCAAVGMRAALQFWAWAGTNSIAHASTAGLVPPATQLLACRQQQRASLAPGAHVLALPTTWLRGYRVPMPQVRLTVAIEDPRARERRLMGMEVRRCCWLEECWSEPGVGLRAT